MDRRFRRNVLVSGVAFFVSTMPACLASDWPQFRGGQTLSGAAPATSGTMLTPVWNVRLPSLIVGGATFGPGISASAAIATVTIGGVQRRTVFIASQNTHVYAFDAGTGNLLWEAAAGDRIESTPLVRDNVVYFVTSGGSLTALDAATGSSLWVHNSGGWQDRASPNFSGTNIICCTGYPKKDIYAVPAGFANPAPEAWHFSTLQFVYSSPAVDPATQNIYCASQDGYVYGLKPDGTALWSTPFYTNGGIFRASPAFGNGRVYITGGNYDWNLHAIDAATGSLAWDAPMRPVPDPDTLSPFDYKNAIISSAAADGNFICLAGGYCNNLGTSQLYAYRDDGATGTLLWKTPLPNRSQQYLSSPAVTPSSVIVGVAAATDPAHPTWPTGRVYVADRTTGATVWYSAGSSAYTGGPILASPAVSGDLVVVGDTSGLVSAYQAVPGGDADGDGVVTVLDAVNLMNVSSGDGIGSPMQTLRADVYPRDTVSPDALRSFGDGKITPGDVDRVLARAVGLELDLP
ncbi:MAG TPA: PQQ-binding-like beta-propeller repeat protein [Armatimonadota bacterium]|jgi:outer membrane protein assembly factor BamB